ncbi:hypothetical protein [Haliscomenobacter hydrossis]|uniref:Uncharacterized protein n=1 Tax=Haliscomenobacter hydrossis (strain ATCC 27775 / DSM 1100 / LMG 10767 / O) TaxID=760192 RepID=F4L118_HALH1|nr:hypothetical protein [Haliscomenobacter hydrossis]AEE51605.1 hypothetical protein Halhy_3753 [Haliscomenobacter hydrossis DSM 1100]
MRPFKIMLLFLLVAQAVFAQKAPKPNKYYNILAGSPRSSSKRVELSSDIDTSWFRWKERGYSFGFNPALTPMYSNVNGILSTPYMVQVRGNPDEKNKKRWGYHVFEGYAKDDKSRITMLVNKHVEENKPVAELYYYGTVYNHSESAYNWFKIGSDVRQHSFLFGRDKAIFYGSLKLSNAFTLGAIGKEDLLETKPAGDDETNAEKDAKYVNYKELKDSGDGTIFYDKDNKIVVIKIDGKWMKLAVEALPAGVEYKF